MGKKRSKKHGSRIGTHMSKSPKRDEEPEITPVAEYTDSVVVEEYTSNNGCRIVRIGLPQRIVVGEDLPADYDLGITVIESEKADDHLSQKQKAQKRGYLSWLFWR